jgi:hypothetical protein
MFRGGPQDDDSVICVHSTMDESERLDEEQNDRNKESRRKAEQNDRFRVRMLPIQEALR